LLVIRLSRKGRRNRPMYRIVVAEHSKPTDGKFVEIVGTYNSIAQNQSLSVNKERVKYWMSQGAQPSNTVAKLLNKVGFDLPVIQKQKLPKKGKKDENQPKESKAEGSATKAKIDEPQKEENKTGEARPEAEEPKIEEKSETKLKGVSTNVNEPEEGSTSEELPPQKKIKPVSKMSLAELTEAHEPKGIFNSEDLPPEKSYGEPCKARLKELTGKSPEEFYTKPETEPEKPAEDIKKEND